MPTKIHSATRAPLQANPYVWRDDTPKNWTARLKFDIPDGLLGEVDF